MPDALLWGIKSSLVAYVRSQSDGTIEASDGAELTSTGTFRFPFVDVSTDEGLRLRYGGGVRLRAHNGLLDIALSEPCIEFSPVPSISVVAEWTGDPPERVTIARMDVAAAAGGGWIGAPVRLTADGALTLGALQYYEGQEVDDASFSAPQP